MYQRCDRRGEPDGKGLPLLKRWRLPLVETCFNRRRLPLFRFGYFHRTADWDGDDGSGSSWSKNWLARRWRRKQS
jgi:hypothetical protein